MSIADNYNIGSIELTKAVPGLIIARGEKGDTGETGATGATGQNGADGASAYEIAVDNGYEGTEEQWLASLKGADGTNGAKGDKGDKGDPGENGSNVFEIWTGTATGSNYSANEITALKVEGALFTYKGHPCVCMEEGTNVVNFIYIDRNASAQSGIKYCTGRVTNTKTVIEDTNYNIVKQINSVDADIQGAVTLTAADIQAAANWSPAANTDLATKKYVDDNAGGIVEKTLQLDVDFTYCGIYNNLFGNGSEIVLNGNQTASGGLLHNCRITGIEGYAGGTWNSLNALYVLGTTVIICNMPFVLNDGNDDYTILGYSTTASTTLEAVEKVRIHYIELDGIETVTPPASS